MKITVEQLTSRFGSSPLFSILKKVIEGTEGLTKPARVAVTHEEADILLALCERHNIYPPPIAIEGTFGLVLEPKAKIPSNTFRNQTGMAISFSAGATNFIEIRTVN